LGALTTARARELISTRTGKIFNVIFTIVTIIGYVVYCLKPLRLFLRITR